jgi:hypothetical protein
MSNNINAIFNNIENNNKKTLEYLNNMFLTYDELKKSFGDVSVDTSPTIDDIIKEDSKKKEVSITTSNKKTITFASYSNASQMAEAIMDHLETVYKGDFIGKYLKPHNDESKGKNSLIYCISNIFKIMRIFNQDFFVRLLTILSDNEIFNEMYNELNDITINEEKEQQIQEKKNFIDSFFIKFSEEQYKNIKSKIYTNKQEELEIKILRDNKLYNLYFESNEKKLLMNQFLYDFIQINNDRGLTNLLTNSKSAQYLGTILCDVIDNILNLKEIYNKYKDFIGPTNIYYKKIIEKYTRIFSYLKYRQDSKTVNPRYSLSIDDNKYLYLRYCNIDGRIGFLNSDDDTSYDYNTAIKFLNDNDAKNEYYTFGPFHGIYTALESNTNAVIAKDFSKKILEKLMADKNVCIIPIGQSGSGKTSSVIYFATVISNELIKSDGIMVEMCNLPEFREHFVKIQLTMKNIYLTHGSNDYKVVNLGVGDNYSPIFEFNNDIKRWLYKDNDKIWMSESINNAFENREVEPTPNNENSSRSHVIVCLKLFKKNNDSVNLVVCDLAGVENKFQINSFSEIKKFDKRYQLSNKYNNKNIIFDNYFKNDNINSAKYDNNDEFKKYNESKEKLQEIYEEYISIVGVNEKDGGNYNIFDDIHYLNDNNWTCDNKLIEIKNLDDNMTIKYIENIEREIQNKKEQTKLAKKVFNLYNIINKPRDNIRINDSMIENIKKLELFPDFFDLDLKFTKNNNKITEHGKIPNNIFYKCKRNYNLQPGEYTSFEHYVYNNELLDYFDLVIYCRYKKQFNGDAVFNIYIPNVEDELKPIKDRKLEKDERVKEIKKKLLEICTLLELGECTTGKNTDNLKKIIGDFKSETYYTYKLLYDFKNKLKDYINEKSETEYEQKKQEYFSSICQLGRVLKIYYNGMLRVNEGLMINKSLKELKDDLKLLVLKSFVNPKTNTLPFIFDKEVFPYCRNLYSDENLYDKFYTMSDKDDTKSGKIIEVIKSFGVNVSELNFAIFTVINISDYFPEKNKVTNNPPNPPYININNLIYLRNIQKIFPNIDKLQSEINNVLKKLEDYEFYKTLEIVINFKQKYESSKPKVLNEMLEYANNLIDLIQTNNSATLIGTLADTDLIQNITADQFPCAENKMLYEERKDFLSEFYISKDTIVETKLQSSDIFKKDILKLQEIKQFQSTDRSSIVPVPPVKKPAKMKDGKKKKSIKLRSKRTYNKR